MRRLALLLSVVVWAGCGDATQGTVSVDAHLVDLGVAVDVGAALDAEVLADAARPPDAAPPSPAWVEVTLSPQRTIYSLSERVAVEAIVFDRVGAPIPSAVVWSVTPASAAQVVDEQVQFLAEGPGVVRACLAERCGEARFFVDDAPPYLGVTAPARGAALGGAEGATVQVRGTASDSRGAVVVRVNGLRVALGEGGAFSLDVPARFGVNTIEVTADDGVRPAVKDVRDVLWAGRYRAADERGITVPQAIVFQLDQVALEPSGELEMPEGAGEVRLTAMADLLTAIVLLADVGSLVPTPQVVDGEALSLRVEGVNLGQPEVDVFFTNLGLELFLGLPNVAIETSGHVLVEGREVSLEGVVQVGLAMFVTLDLSLDGALRVELGETGVAVGAMRSAYVDPTADALVSTVGSAVANVVNDMAEDLADTLVREQIPSLLEASLDGLLGGLSQIPIEIPPTVDGGRALSLLLELTPSSVTLSPRRAMALGFDARISQAPVQAPHADPGVPLLADEAALSVPSAGLAVELRLALLNGLLHEVWRGGLLQLSPAIPAGLSGLLEGVEVDARLTPVIVPGDDPKARALEIQIGDLRVAVDAAGGEGVDVYALSLKVGVLVRATGGRFELLVPADPEVVGVLIEQGSDRPLLTGEQLAQLVIEVVWPEVRTALDGGLSFGLGAIALNPDSLEAITPRLTGLAITPRLGDELRLLGGRLRLEGHLEFQLEVE